MKIKRKPTKEKQKELESARNSILQKNIKCPFCSNEDLHLHSFLTLFLNDGGIIEENKYILFGILKTRYNYYRYECPNCGAIWESELFLNPYDIRNLK